MTEDDVASYRAAHEALLARGHGRMVPDLDRITQLLGLLGDPQLAYPSVHLTGTNGKTSVTRMVATLCSAAGISAGAFTSPHLQSVRERMQVTGRPIAPSAFARVHDELTPLLALVDDAGDDRVTYFEATVAMALWWFAEVPVDVAVVEVGMGGRWDATNLVRSDVAVLTPVDVDHSRFLGRTPEEVAREKTGIVKPTTEVVVTTQQRPGVLAQVRAAAAANDAELWVAAPATDGEDPAATTFGVVQRSAAVGGQVVGLRVGGRVVRDVFLPLHGAHQADNAALALAAFAAFAGRAFDAMDDDVVRAAFAAVTVPGRLEVLAESPAVVLDGAHNPHGVRSLARTLGEAFTFPRLVLLLAVLGDKDVDAMLRALADPDDGIGAAHVVVTTTGDERSMPVDDLLAAAEEAFDDDVEVDAAPDVAAALDLARDEAGGDGGVLVTGSLLTVGAARDLLRPFAEVEPPIVADEDLAVDDDADYDDALDAMFDRVDAERAAALAEDLGGAPDVLDLLD